MPMPLTNLAIILAGGGAALMVFISGLSDLQRPDVVRMELGSLEYKNGKFHQSHVVTGASRVRADWAANITRNGNFLCVGGGTSSYKNGSSPPMDPSFWTGANCPELKPGDVASATWEYVDDRNLRRRIGGEITIE